jgi:cell division septation protein DedD
MLIAGYMFAGGANDFPALSVASYNAESGVARIVIDWKKVPPDDERHFGLYRSTGEKADVYTLIATLNTSMAVYRDTGLNTDTEYHYIIGGALPYQELPQTKARGKKERRTEQSSPRATIAYGKAPAGADTVVGDAPPPGQADDTRDPPSQTGGNLPQLAQAADTRPPPSQSQTGDYLSASAQADGYQPSPSQTGGYQPVPSQADTANAVPPQAGGNQPSPSQTGSYQSAPSQAGTVNAAPSLPSVVFENEGVFFTMSYFSNRVYELTGQANKPVVISLGDSNAQSQLASLVNQSYMRSPLPGTSLYYAIHNALNRMSGWDANGALSRFDTILLVTITDGLDTSSTDPSLTPIESVWFRSANEYQDFVRKNIEGRRIGGKKITAISIGLQGADTITGWDYETTLRAVANAEDNVYRIPLRNLTKTLQDIAVSVTSGMTARPVGFVTPAYPNGTEIFIALDSFSTPSRGQNFIAGRIRVTGNRHYLENITLGGLARDATSVPAGGIVGQISPSGGVEWQFDFSQTLNPSKVVLYYKDTEWRGTKEFTVRTYSPIDSRRTVLVYLLIDNSSSIPAQNIAVIRESAVKFIDALSVNASGAQPSYSRGETLAMVPLQGQLPEPLWEQRPSLGNRPEIAAQSDTETAQEPSQNIAPDTGAAPYWESPKPELTARQPADPREERSQPSGNRAEPPHTYSQTSPQAFPVVLPESIPRSISGSTGYWVQASSSENRSMAEGIIAQLRQYQLTPIITEAQVRGKTFYRVRIGPYASLADASLVAEFVKQPPLGFYDSFIP